MMMALVIGEDVTVGHDAILHACTMKSMLPIGWNEFEDKWLKLSSRAK